MSEKTKQDNFGNWLCLNCPKEVRKRKHLEVVKFVFNRYYEEITFLELKSGTEKDILNQIFLNKNLHKPIFIEPKKEPPTINFNKKRKRIIKRAKGKIDLESFYLTDKWLLLKRKIHKLYKCGCMKCGIEGVETHIDHIFPRSIYPDLELNIHNLQILCKKCNIEKSNNNTIDYRTSEQKKMCSIKFN